MKWDVRGALSLKKVSVFAVLFAAVAAGVCFAPSEKSVVRSAKHAVKDKVKVAKKISKKTSVKKERQKQVAQKSEITKSKKVSLEEQKKKMQLVKKSKSKVRLIAQNTRVRLRSNSTLSMDGWNLDHEQVESLSEKIGDDPYNASGFEDRKLEEELADAGL